MFFDVHTHQCISTSSILSIHARNYIYKPDIQCNMFSAGVHPWYAEAQLSADFIHFVKQKTPQKMVAVGECGVDHIKGPDLNTQIKIFEAHVKLAAEMEIPVIVHQVKAIGDLFPLIKANAEVVFIMHGYNENMKQTEQLLKYNVYFSFGKAIFTPSDKLKTTLQNIPVDRIFFETDDTQTQIDLLYRQFTKYQSIKIDKLQQMVKENFQQTFKRKV